MVQEWLCKLINFKRSTKNYIKNSKYILEGAHGTRKTATQYLCSSLNIFSSFLPLLGEVQIAEDLMLVNHIKNNFFHFQAPLAGHYSSIDSSSCLVIFSLSLTPSLSQTNLKILLLHTKLTPTHALFQIHFILSKHTMFLLYCAVKCIY